MLKTWYNQMVSVFKNTTDFKGKTDLKSCVYAMLFQLVIISIVVVFVSVSSVLKIGIGFKIFGYIFLIYSLLSSFSFTTLLARRLRDTGINPMLFVYSIWFTYILVGLFRFITFFYNALNFFIPLISYFIVHFFTIMMVLMPTKDE